MSPNLHQASGFNHKRAPEGIAHFIVDNSLKRWSKELREECLVILRKTDFPLSTFL